MQSLRFPALGSEKEMNSAMNVVIAYEDLETGKRAIKTYEYMVEQLGDECLFSNQMWKFDVLSVPKLKDVAAKDASLADIIIVSAHEGKPLPAPIQSWMETWVSYGTQASALVGLFGNESVNSPVRNYLAEVARRAKIEFFCQPGIWPGANRNGVSAPWHSADKSYAFLHRTPDVPPVSHWGINE